MGGRMAGEKIRRRALEHLGIAKALGGPLTLPEGAVGVRVWGTGLPNEGVEISREEMEAGVVAVDAGPPPAGSGFNGPLF